ncbi:hypothetical protein [Candidatus Nitrosocosmicus hydrocola]|uniref:hypothetical protein n=1 Tax=Candidatus Nitrosocosmicus hydrocola TaxID=1826872 RepID=UPI0013732CDD|nr:hypothetical protein [Candidatus Nitrosocosmicus hydrocola]
MAPFYETEDTVRKYLSKSQNLLNTDKGERNEKSLMIVDSLKKYFGNDSLESDYV